MLLELAKQARLNSKRVSSTGGGEYHSPCPACGGDDRFIIQPFWDGRGRYYCRQCKRHGDSIQFCRDFLGMTFKEAQERVGVHNNGRHERIQSPEIRAIKTPAKTWQEKAAEFVEGCSKRLLIDPEAMDFVKQKYGLTPETLSRFQVGWNPEKRFHRKSEWGIQETENKLWTCLPKGIVIPSFLSDGALSKIKIRRSDWNEGDRYGKYQEVEGSSNLMPIYGQCMNEVAMIVESELDAMCLCQEVGEFCTCVALGGATKRPDVITVEWLKERRLILYSLDFDETGDNEYGYWVSSFRQLGRWRSDSHKSPAESYILGGVNLREWFLAGVGFWSKRALPKDLINF